MEEDKNIGIMTTLKKTYPERRHPGRMLLRPGCGHGRRRCQAGRHQLELRQGADQGLARPGRQVPG